MFPPPSIPPSFHMICSQCPPSPILPSYTQPHLEEHFARVHLDIYRIKCTVCSALFYTDDATSLHVSQCSNAKFEFHLISEENKQCIDMFVHNTIMTHIMAVDQYKGSICGMIGLSHPTPPFLPPGAKQNNLSIANLKRKIVNPPQMPVKRISRVNNNNSNENIPIVTIDDKNEEKEQEKSKGNGTPENIPTPAVAEDADVWANVNALID